MLAAGCRKPRKETSRVTVLCSQSVCAASHRVTWYIKKIPIFTEKAAHNGGVTGTFFCHGMDIHRIVWPFTLL